jgi:hypothetical protein
MVPHNNRGVGRSSENLEAAVWVNIGDSARFMTRRVWGATRIPTSGNSAGNPWWKALTIENKAGKNKWNSAGNRLSRHSNNGSIKTYATYDGETLKLEKLFYSIQLLNSPLYTFGEVLGLLPMHRPAPFGRGIEGALNVDDFVILVRSAWPFTSD